MANGKKVKGTQKKTEPQPKESNLIWFGIVLIVGAAVIIWLANSLNPAESGLPDDTLVRKTIRDQFNALFELDKDEFLGFYSQDYDNGEYTYVDKVAQLEGIGEVPFKVKDFALEFIESGGEVKEEVHFDKERGFASTYVYSYWRQRKEDGITMVPVQKLTVFLLRKEGAQWRIISDSSITLRQREDAEHLMATPQWRTFMDPTTIIWPPPKVEPKEPETASGPEPEGKEGEGETVEDNEQPSNGEL